MRKALIISVAAHALFWGLNALHAPKPLASSGETPIVVDIASPDEIGAAPKPESTDTKEASPAGKSESQPLPPQQSPDQTAQGQQTPTAPAERTAPDWAPKVAQAAWDPRQSLPAGSWLDSALGTPLITTNAFDPAETVANLSQQEIAALRARLKECWKPPAGLADTEDLVVMLRVSLKPDGTLRDDPAMLAASASENGPALLRTAASALRQCQPYSFLPAAKYKEWKILDLSFSPTGLSTKRIAPVL